MEDAGVQVVYGLVGLKTHCKLALLVRDEGEKLSRYAHLGTGNYNPTTAKAYTDLSLLTAREDVTNDVAEVFNLLTSHSRPKKMNRLVVAPHEMLHSILALIEAEAAEARAGRPARIVAKMNALVDRDVIMALYDASKAGVEIDLVVRGICCLRPGVPGLSERIRVRSIVGRYLEHSRAYVFHSGGVPRVFLGSADLMPRNLRGRVEVLFPIDDPALSAHVRDDILAVYLEPRPKVRILDAEGRYVPVPKADWVEDVDPQSVFMRRAQKQIEKAQRVVERPRRPKLPARGERPRRSSPRAAR
jgi:polyphosphate kinase